MKFQHENSSVCGVCQKLSLYIRLTNACNASCVMCELYKQKPLYLDEACLEKLLEDAGGMNVGEVTFTGGEPFLYPFLGRAADLCLRSGAELSIITNGSLLWRLPDIFKKRLVKRLILSLDHFPKTHDELRGVGGLWWEAVVGISKIKKRYSKDITVRIQTVVSNMNYNNLQKLYHAVSRIVSFEEVTLIPIKGHQELSLSSIQRLEFIKSGARLKSFLLERGITLLTSPELFEFQDPETMTVGQRRGCQYVSQVTAFVDGVTGNVFPCNILPHCGVPQFCIGNIKQSNLGSIWHSEKAKTIRKRLKSEGCGFSEFCDPVNRFKNNAHEYAQVGAGGGA